MPYGYRPRRGNDQVCDSARGRDRDACGRYRPASGRYRPPVRFSLRKSANFVAGREGGDLARRVQPQPRRGGRNEGARSKGATVWTTGGSPESTASGVNVAPTRRTKFFLALRVRVWDGMHRPRMQPRPRKNSFLRLLSAGPRPGDECSAWNAGRTAPRDRGDLCSGRHANLRPTCRPIDRAHTRRHSAAAVGVPPVVAAAELRS
jgi:hypothetical protein